MGQVRAESHAFDALSELARSWRRYEGDVDRALRAITFAAAGALDVERASVWLLDVDRTVLRCADLYERSKNVHTSGLTLRAADYPAYFAALEAEDPINADDACIDPRTSDFGPDYLLPFGIGAMLDAPVRRGQRLIGVVCHEHVGPPRQWTPAEERDAAFLASLASLALELAERARHEALLTATLESTGEGILAADGERVVAFNRRFLHMWGLESVEVSTLAGVHERMTAVTAGRELPLPDIGVDGARGSDSLEHVELADGRVLEWVSRPQVLREQVVGSVWSFRDVTVQRRIESELRASEARMRDLAIRDGLTGLFNRRHAIEQLSSAVGRALAVTERMAVALVDLDHFKRINDALGHLAGDQVLRDFGKLLLERVRGSDLVGRYGGEEFVVVLRGANAGAGRAVLEKLREVLAERGAHDGLPAYTFSAGVAELGGDGCDAPELLACADARLYQAKRGGRDRIL